MSQIPDTSIAADVRAYLTARARVEKQITRLVQARGFAVGVEIDSGQSYSRLLTHQIHLSYGRRVRIMAVDHETFMNEELFETLVLHQVKAAIGELAWSPDGSRGRLGQEDTKPVRA